MRTQVGVEFVLNDTRLDAGPTFRSVDLQNLVQILGKIQHHSMTHRLPGQAGATAAWQHRDLVAPGDVHRGDDIPHVPRDDDADGFDLVHAGVGAVQGPGVGVEANLSIDDLTQLFIERAHAPKPPYPLRLIMCCPSWTCDSCGVSPACSRTVRMGSCAATRSRRSASFVSAAARCSSALPTRTASV